MQRTALFITLIVLLLFTPINSLEAQAAILEASLSEQIDKAELIIEGRVISKKSFWATDQKNIFTKNTIEVYKVFKGDTPSQVEVITKGGWIGNQGVIVSPSLQVQIDNTGVFMLYATKKALTNNKTYNPYSGPQAFYKYSISENKVTTVFKSYEGIENNFYDELTKRTKSPYKVLVSKDFTANYNRIQANKALKVISVTNVEPNIISAGTASELTITGTDFGNNMGKVYFQDANEVSGTIPALDSQIKSWSPSVVVVEVPSYSMGGESFTAGTGSVIVEDSDGFSSPPSIDAEITVSYAISNFESEGIAYPAQHADLVDVAGDGGYIWQMNTEFAANIPAQEAFIRALESWRCETGVNWTMSSTNTTEDVDDLDNINMVRFDNGNELEAMVLGQCATYAAICPSVPPVAFVQELDIIFDDLTTWEFGPDEATGPEVDFESVALHELGHGHQLGHVIDDTAVMHRSLSNGDNRRELSANDILGANNVQSRSTSIGVQCVDDNSMPIDLMTDYSGNCSTASVPDVELNSFIFYPNPTKSLIFVKNPSLANLEKVHIYDARGVLVLEHVFSNSNNNKSISFKNFSNGLYFMNVYSDLGMTTKKIIKE